MIAILAAAGGGFLLGVLWMDLLFDLQVLRHPRTEPLPEPTLASIAGYYRRVTTEARPLGHAVGAAMVATLAALVVELAADGSSRAVSAASLVLLGAPVVLAFRRVLPYAVRLGSRADPPERQSELARSICRDHLLCLAAVLAFLALRAWAAAG